MKRWMAIDFGKKRVGIALTDLLKITAQPYETLIIRKKEQLISAIKKIAEEEDVEKIIVGLPLHMDGSESKAAEASRSFADELSRVLSIPVEMWDERLTTVEAERTLIEKANLSRLKRKNKIDKLAATFLLQSYMESNKP